MFRFVKNILSQSQPEPPERGGQAIGVRRVLNVGGNNKTIAIPAYYDGWEHVLLDIDPAGNPDVICDARDLASLGAGEYDAVYCSHNLEHYYRHDVRRVLGGFRHVLRQDGFAHIRVPDMEELMQRAVANRLDIDDVLYDSSRGPISVLDVIYGYAVEIEDSGNDFYAHKTGFTRKSLTTALRAAGFTHVYTKAGELEVVAIAFKQRPDGATIALLGIDKDYRPEQDNGEVPVANPASESANLRRQGNRLLAQGDREAAEACYRQAISVNPAEAGAHLNLGFVLAERGQDAEARGFLEEAVRLDPRLEDAHYLLGTLTERLGDVEAAIRHLDAALALRPDMEVASRDLCRVLFHRGDYDRARQVAAQGLRLNPQSADLLFYLGNLHLHAKAYEPAIACYEKALSIQPDYAAVLSNLGKACMEQGRVEAAVAHYRKALQIDADAIAVEAMSCLLFARSYQAGDTPQAYLEEARRYGRMVAAKATPYADWPRSRTQAGPLRVGLVSGDFLSHPVGYFLEGILKHLRPGKVALVAYPTVPEEDDLTARIKPSFQAWHSLAGLSDAAAARRIHEDGIQLLVDLAGHTSHNRLPVFAWRPAPVQATWLGYFASTGVAEMDYLLADPISVPESECANFTEKIWYLPDTRLCFTPPGSRDALPPGPLPAQRNGHLTYGCFQNVSKLNDDVLSVWGRIFRAQPQARLRIRSKQLDDAAARDRLLKRLAAAGVPPANVALEGPSSREQYLAAHRDIDVMLDTFPYPGGTTTCEALWMGVPTLTLAGNTLLSRQGASLLACAGLADWVAANEADYVDKAAALTGDIDRLAALRAGLRDRALASPLFDAPRFAANLEEAFLAMWLDHGWGGVAGAAANGKEGAP